MRAAANFACDWKSDRASRNTAATVECMMKPRRSYAERHQRRPMCCVLSIMAIKCHGTCRSCKVLKIVKGQRVRPADRLHRSLTQAKIETAQGSGLCEPPLEGRPSRCPTSSHIALSTRDGRTAIGPSRHLYQAFHVLFLRGLRVEPKRQQQIAGGRQAPQGTRLNSVSLRSTRSRTMSKWLLATRRSVDCKF